MLAPCFPNLSKRKLSLGGFPFMGYIFEIMFRFSLAQWTVTERKKKEAYFSLRKLLATILGLAEVTATILCTVRASSHMCFRAFLLQFSFFFLVLQALGRSTLPAPVFWYLDFWFLSFQLASHISCYVLIGHAVHRYFMYWKMFAVCRLLLAITHREFTAVLCYFLFSPWQREKLYLNDKKYTDICCNNMCSTYPHFDHIMMYHPYYH